MSRRHKQVTVANHLGKCEVCGKFRYRTKKGAKQAAAQIFPGQLMRVYDCGPWWHITSQPTEVVTRHRDRAAAAERLR